MEEKSNNNDDNTLLINQKSKCSKIKYHLKNTMYEIIYLLLKNNEPIIPLYAFLSLTHIIQIGYFSFDIYVEDSWVKGSLYTQVQ